MIRIYLSTYYLAIMQKNLEIFPSIVIDFILYRRRETIVDIQYYALLCVEKSSVEHILTNIISQENGIFNEG